MRAPNADYQATRFAKQTDPAMRIDPSPATADKNVTRGLPPKNPEDNEQSLAKGGTVKRTGSIKAHKGEVVIRKAAVQKHGPKKMAAVNKGTAKITMPSKGKKR